MHGWVYETGNNFLQQKLQPRKSTQELNRRYQEDDYKPNITRFPNRLKYNEPTESSESYSEEELFSDIESD